MPTPDATAFSPTSTPLPPTLACAPLNGSSICSNTANNSSNTNNCNSHGHGVSAGLGRAFHVAGSVVPASSPVATFSHSPLHQSQPYLPPHHHLQQQQSHQQQLQPQIPPLGSPLSSSAAVNVGTTISATTTTPTVAANVPDPVVMEFISKIGQIIIKARTKTLPVLLTTDHLTPSPSHLDTVLLDRELWRNNSSVYLNIFHAAQFALLERWVISFTLPVRPPVAADCIASARSGFSSPLGHSAGALPASPASSTSFGTELGATAVTSAPTTSYSTAKTTTDLILLVQSLYSQIRTLPLNNCLTSFDEATRIIKEQLDYTVTSGQEDLTQSCQPPGLRQNQAVQESELDMDGNYVQDPIDVEPSLSNQAHQRPPLEFLENASLKLVQFEASHKSWGCVRVTGMYDESVGGRISPKNFQDAAKPLRKKSNHRAKDTSSSKSTSRKHHLTNTDSVESTTAQPDKDDAAEGLCTTQPQSEDESPPRKLQFTHSSSPPRTSTAALHQRPMSPIPTKDDVVHHQTSSLIRHGMLPALYPSDYPAAASTHHSLQESLDSTTSATTDADQAPNTHTKETMEAFQFPPVLSPPLAIPEKGVKGTGNTPSYHRAREPLEGQRSHQFPGGAYSIDSTSPVRHTISRRRSSRLSIVMNRSDLSPEPTSPNATPKKSPTSPLSQTRDMDIDPPNARYGHHRSGSFKASCGPSPTKHSYLRRNSLNPVVSGSDLFGSLVGSYEESILSGRMSTMPSKPLTFIAQIGVLASQEYKDCPPKLRCPRHVQLEFPAVFYDYDSSFSSSHHQHHHHHYQYHHPLSGSITKGMHHSSLQSGWTGPSSAAATSFPSNHHGSLSQSHSYTHGWLSNSFAHDDPVLPYVGNVDLDNGFRGSKRFAKMPGGMRIPLRGQVQVMIKNPNKTVVKVFLVPYDFTDMPPNTKTFLRQKYYSLDQGIPALTSSSTTTTTQGSSNANSSTGGGTLRYAIHLQFCCPAEGYVYLYRTIRVVFANRVPDGKEKLRIVLEGLGAGNQKSSSTGTTVANATSDKVSVEQKYVPMRKGEVLFSGRRKRRITLHAEDGDHSTEASPQLHQHSAQPLSPQVQQHVVHNPHHPLNAQMPSHQHAYRNVHPHARVHLCNPNYDYQPQSPQGLGLGLGFPNNNGSTTLYPAQKWTLGQMGPNGELQQQQQHDSTTLQENYSHGDANQQYQHHQQNFTSYAGSTQSPNPTSPKPVSNGNMKDWEYLYQTDTSYQDIPSSVLIGTPAMTLKNSSLNLSSSSSGSTINLPSPLSHHHHNAANIMSPSLLSKAVSSSSPSYSPSSSSPSLPPSSPSTSSFDRLKTAVSSVGEEVLRIKSLAHGLKQMGVRSPPNTGNGTVSPPTSSS
ncbi:hypothetical protein BGW41_001246 [Actinomortierella wolfii]|nr:hypothetical protein BGW41_001246 [Actinomortierella wolfii]